MQKTMIALAAAAVGYYIWKQKNDAASTSAANGTSKTGVTVPASQIVDATPNNPPQTGGLDPLPPTPTTGGIEPRVAAAVPVPGGAVFGGGSTAAPSSGSGTYIDLGNGSAAYVPAGSLRLGLA